MNNNQPKEPPMKTHIRKIKSNIGALAKLACGIRLLRLHPKFRWLNYACPILDRTQTLNSERKTVNPPVSPPRLRLRKRRRLSVQTTRNREL
jgi:hypothetical protein